MINITDFISRISFSIFFIHEIILYYVKIPVMFRPKYIDRKLLVLNVREQLFIMSIAKKGKALSV